MKHPHDFGGITPDIGFSVLQLSAHAKQNYAKGIIGDMFPIQLSRKSSINCAIASG